MILNLSDQLSEGYGTNNNGGNLYFKMTKWIEGLRHQLIGGREKKDESERHMVEIGKFFTVIYY